MKKRDLLDYKVSAFWAILPVVFGFLNSPRIGILSFWYVGAPYCTYKYLSLYQWEDPQRYNDPMNKAVASKKRQIVLRNNDGLTTLGKFVFCLLVLAEIIIGIVSAKSI